MIHVRITDRKKPSNLCTYGRSICFGMHPEFTPNRDLGIPSVHACAYGDSCNAAETPSSNLRIRLPTGASAGNRLLLVRS